jgi:hypothetical protein
MSDTKQIRILRANIPEKLRVTLLGCISFVISQRLNV